MWGQDSMVERQPSSSWLFFGWCSSGHLLAQDLRDLLIPQKEPTLWLLTKFCSLHLSAQRWAGKMELALPGDAWHINVPYSLFQPQHLRS